MADSWAANGSAPVDGAIMGMGRVGGRRGPPVDAAAEYKSRNLEEKAAAAAAAAAAEAAGSAAGAAVMGTGAAVSAGGILLIFN